MGLAVVVVENRFTGGSLDASQFYYKIKVLRNAEISQLSKYHKILDSKYPK